MPKKINIELVPAKAFQIKKNSKYLLIMPKGYVQGGEVGKAITAFFGSTKVLVLGPENVNEIKIAELLSEE